MDKIHKDRAEDKRPDAKEHILHDPSYIKFKNEQNECMLLETVDYS